MALGWRYLAIGTVLALFLSLVLVLGTKSPTVFATTFPLEIPLFAILGSSGALITFVSDRTKGVFEYLIAYGVRPRSLFVDSLIATAALAALILGLALGVGLSIALSHGITLTTDLSESLAFYTVPMGFAGALFTSTVGMIWSSVSTPRTGINSPIGIAPMVGITPGILVLIVAEALPHGQFYYFTAGAAGVIIAAVALLLALSARLMGRDRFLSPL
ncbi:MAG: hypothetical protein L3K23_08780 [Thermoplasmata archaeon]|nr:hypothetical protein [Thermoplasmata archaeon]